MSRQQLRRFEEIIITENGLVIAVDAMPPTSCCHTRYQQLVELRGQGMKAKEIAVI